MKEFKVTTTGTSYTVKKLSAGKKYSFKVRAYTADKTYGEFSSAINTATLLSTVTGLKTTKTAANYIKLSWKKVSSADKYIVEIYKGGEWIKYKTVTTNSQMKKLWTFTKVIIHILKKAITMQSMLQRNSVGKQYRV